MTRGQGLGPIVLSALVLGGCGQAMLVPNLQPPRAPLPPASEDAQLKVHMKSGELYVLDRWELGEDGARLRGRGKAYAVTRLQLGSGSYDVALTDVALLETNDVRALYPAGAQVLAVASVVMGTVTGICVADPKSCFGSCPTFYLDGEHDRPRAEGFSGSIARVLEERDVDALHGVRARSGTLALTMRNEALETHAVRSVRLLAVPRGASHRVLAGSDGRFHAASGLVQPASCHALEGDCRRALSALDGRERWSEANAHDLATRETIELTFPAQRGRIGVLVGARASLMTTFLFYQSLAYLGRNAGEALAAMERSTPERARAMLAMGDRLGGIDVEISEGEEAWRSPGTYNEPGPIAGDVLVLPATAAGNGPLHVRLRLARGAWRLDAVGVARLGETVDPIRLEPARVERAGQADARALSALLDGERHLVTLPGDAYRIVFDVPPALSNAEFFLESEGYYYEWMRTEWLADEDPALARLVVARPDEALRRLAPEFKKREATMEQAFWGSRFRK